jgi:hypothetical protein
MLAALKRPDEDAPVAFRMLVEDSVQPYLQVGGRPIRKDPPPGNRSRGTVTSVSTGATVTSP